jgi:hypothetical protein
MLAGLLLLVVVGFTQAAPPAPQKWEYKYASKFNDLNKLGDEGWELVAVTEYNGVASTFYLKRAK